MNGTCTGSGLQCTACLNRVIGSYANINVSFSLDYNIPYSRKYWRALNLVVEPKIAIERILADLNLAIRYGIAIRIYANLAVVL